MDTPKTENTCDRCIEYLIDRQPLSKEEQQHVVSCKDCKSVINTMGAIALQGSVYDEDFSGLKLRLMKKLVPQMAKCANSVATNSSMFSQILPWLLSFTVVGAMLVMFGIFSPGASVNNHNGEKASVRVASVSTFKIAINGETPRTISLDEPVAISDKQKALITIPDGSKLEVKGPARLNINPRGFHLVSGFLTAKVKKGKTPFISTTPQGQIRVLGTIYDCNVEKEKTTVRLKRGSVKIIPDYGSPVILKPGESSTMSLSPKEKPETERIPPIDSE